VTSVEGPRIERIRAGNEAEFKELFQAHYPALCAFAYRFTGSTSGAEEIVQTVFVDLWEQRERLRVHTSLRSYLYAATRNRALDERKHEQVEARWAERSRAEDDVSSEGERDAQQTLEASETSDALHAAIAHLPERAQEVVTLRWLRGLKPPEVAEVLGISVKGVEIQITRALRALRAQMERKAT
jgi:RNA polymerase sigma-70 factor (ECF subfamily)